MGYPAVVLPFDGNLRDAWRAEADAWAAWAATPDHDVFFWRFNLPAFLPLVPPPGRATLDLGCGEGRVARALAAHGHRLVGVDAAIPLVRRAGADPRQPIPVAAADANALPVRDGSVDLVIAFMLLQDVDDLVATTCEVARVLEPRGRLCFAILHPIATAGDFAGPSADSAFVIERAYDEPFRFTELGERAGLRMRFHSEHRPLGTYVDALADAGLVIERLREPVPDAALVDDDPLRLRQRRIPWYLHGRARKDG